MSLVVTTTLECCGINAVLSRLFLFYFLVILFYCRNVVTLFSDLQFYSKHKVFVCSNVDSELKLCK